MNKDLLFMLENGEEFIKGIYEASEDRIYHPKKSQQISMIKSDEALLDKIKNHKSNKLLFKYNNNDFNKMLNLC